MKFRSPKGDYEIDSLHKVLTVRIKCNLENKNSNRHYLLLCPFLTIFFLESFSFSSKSF